MSNNGSSFLPPIIASFAIQQKAVILHKDPEFRALAGQVSLEGLPYKECGKSQEAIFEVKKGEKGRPEVGLPIVKFKKWGWEMRMKSAASSFAYGGQQPGWQRVTWSTRRRSGMADGVGLNSPALL